MEQSLLQLSTEASYPYSLYSSLLLTETFYTERRRSKHPRPHATSSPWLLLLPAKAVRSTSATVSTLLLTPTPRAAVARGVCWSPAPAPTVRDAQVLIHPTDGAAATLLTGLRPNTTYYCRAFTTTTDGRTTYSNQICFTTAALPAPAARVLPLLTQTRARA